MNVREYLQRSPVVVQPDETIESAARTMAREGVGTLIVADHGRLVGIVTDRDLVLRALATRTPLDARIDSVMSMNVVAVDADSDVRDALRAFSHHAVRRLPVLDGDTIVGLVSVDEMTIVLAEEFGELVKGLTAQLMFPHAADPVPVPAKVG